MFFQNGQIIDTPEDFAAMFRYELLPLLQEYLFDDYRALADLLGTVIDVDDQRVSDLASDPEALCAELASRYGSASA
jgi:5-methylcytosine-specific restriction protein B